MENILALDIGLKRIGIAVCLQGIVIPHTPILRRNRNQAAKEVSQILNEKQPKIIVVGIPEGGSTSEEMAKRIKHFVGLLKIPQNTKIIFVDEAYSSFEAGQRMQGSKKIRKKDGSLDSLAAMIILERYLREVHTINEQETKQEVFHSGAN